MSSLDDSESQMLSSKLDSTLASDNFVGNLASFIDRADPGTRASLARLDPSSMRPHHIAALSRALIGAGFSPETWRPSTWRRWAIVAHGIALAGHDSKSRVGVQLAAARVAEARVTKLLVSRGDAFLQILPRLLRLLASKQIKPNWYDLSKLVHKNDASDYKDQEEVEALRLRIAGDYFSAVSRAKS